MKWYHRQPWARIRNFLRRLVGLPPVYLTVKPTGTISLLGSCTGGYDPPLNTAPFQRRVRYAELHWRR